MKGAYFSWFSPEHFSICGENKASVMQCIAAYIMPGISRSLWWISKSVCEEVTISVTKIKAEAVLRISVIKMPF